jgi:hypothetical protein
MKWINPKDEIPEIRDDSVLIHFANGSIETCHIEDLFGVVTAGLTDDGEQLYTQMYLEHEPAVTHWMKLPEPPIN